MLNVIKSFFSDLAQAEEPETFVHSRKQLAQAALMYHVVAADGVVRPEEKQRLKDILASEYDLSETETERLVQDGKEADAEAIDLYGFTSILRRSLDEEERLTIVENLWEMVFADGELHELEDHTLWRIAELLGVDGPARLAMKQRVMRRTVQGSQG